MKRTTKRKGFTLVELLIVIVVIGILSAMMMMSSSEAVSSARASTITSNMRNLQTAALAYWADNMNVFNKTDAPAPTFKGDTPTAGTTKVIVDYLKDDDNSNIDFDDYEVEVPSSGTNQGDWFIKYTFNSNKGDDEKVKQKVAGRAASLGLMSQPSTASKDVYLGTGDNLFILVR